MNNLRHVILYAKGHYVVGRSMFQDVLTIHKAIGLGDGWRPIIENLSKLALTAIRNAEGTVTPLTEYTEQMVFLYTSGGNMIDLFGPSPLDDERDMKEKMLFMYQESIVRSLLVIIARWRIEEILGDPDKDILPLTNANEKKFVRTKKKRTGGS